MENSKEKTEHLSGDALSLEQALEALPEAQRSIIVERLKMQVSSYQGPLPPPDLLAAYAKVIQDSPERMLRIAEKQVDHRIASESEIIRKSFRLKFMGQIYGFILAILFGVCTLWLGLTGHDVLAGLVGVTTILGLAVVFVLNRKPDIGPSAGERHDLAQ